MLTLTLIEFVMIFQLPNRWNEALKTDVLPRVYVRALNILRDAGLWQIPATTHPDKWLSSNYWPLFPSSAGRAEWKDCVREIYAMIGKSEHALLPEVQFDGAGKPFIGEWKPVCDVYFPAPGLSRSLLRILTGLGMKIVDSTVPERVPQEFLNAGVEARVISPAAVAGYLRTLAGSDCLQLPRSVTETLFKSSQNVAELLGYVLTDDELGLDGLPLLLTADGFLRQFDSVSKVVILKEDYQKLFPRMEAQFLSSDLLKSEAARKEFMPSFNAEEKSERAREVSRVLDVSTVAEFLPVCFPKNFPLSDDAGETRRPELGVEFALDKVWLERFWELLSQLILEHRESTPREVLISNFGNWFIIPADIAAGRSQLFRVSFLLFSCIFPPVILRGLFFSPVMRCLWWTSWRKLATSPSWSAYRVFLSWEPAVIGSWGMFC